MYIQNVHTKCTYIMYIQNVYLMYTFDILVYKMGTKNYSAIKNMDTKWLHKMNTKWRYKMAPSCIQNGYNININMYKMYIRNVHTKRIFNVHTFDILMYIMGTKFVLKTTVPLKIWIQNEHTRLHVLVYNMHTI